MAEHWDLPNTGIFYSEDVASAATNVGDSVPQLLFLTSILFPSFFLFPVGRGAYDFFVSFLFSLSGKTLSRPLQLKKIAELFTTFQEKRFLIYSTSI
jgi:hypothetical protein